MRRRTGFTFVTLLVIISMIAVGCTPKNDSGDANETVFRMNLSEEPPTLDPAQSQDQVSSTVINGMYEGLTRKNENGDVEAGMAASWEISEDNLTYTFKIRDDAKWSNGDPVTANDFEFSWKRALDPELAPKPAAYAYQLYYIKGAEAYNMGEATADTVGVKALDEKTLEVVLNTPTPYFLGLLSFPTYYPVHQSVKDNEAWASEASTMITNGPFKMSEWKKNNSITLAKNENYYALDKVGLDKVRFTMVNDSATELNMYQTGELDFTGMPTGLIPLDQLKVMQEKYPDEFHVKGTASTYYYMFNTTVEPFSNEKVRQALSMAINRQEIADKVALGGEIPAYGFVPPGIKGLSEEYRDEVSDNYFTEDLEEAKKLLAEGLAELGMDKLPPFSLIYNTNDKHHNIAQAIAEMWRTNLGAEVTLGNSEFGVFIDTRNKLNYEVARGGWGADYDDPMSFLDLFTSNSGNNNTGFASPEYDALIKKASSTADQEERMKALAEAEKMLIDSRAIMPIYYYTSVNMMKPEFKGIFIDYKGDIDYTRGYKEVEEAE